MELVTAYPGDGGAEARWRLCLAGVDGILTLFGQDDEAKLAFAHSARETFAREFGAKNSPLEKQLGDRFRKERKALEALLNGQPDPSLAPGLEILARRDATLMTLAQDMTRIVSETSPATSKDDLIRSLVHMFVNRSQRSAQRMQEFVIYDFLERIYDSRIARLKKSAKDTAISPKRNRDESVGLAMQNR